MSPKVCKRISRQTDKILVEWLKSIVDGDEKDKVNLDNIYSLIPPTNYFMVNRSLRLSFYSPKWVRKSIKKLFKQGMVIENISMADLERLASYQK